MANNSECEVAVVLPPGQPIFSAVMFSSGVVGNTLALVLLEVRRRRTSPSLYQVLVTALLMTDLLGSVSVSPVVLSAYAQKKTLLGMSKNKEVCCYFGFSMTFLSISTLGILCVMALERYLSIGQPYFYEKYLNKLCGYIAIALIYLGSTIFCIVPFLGLGEYVQYCPGSWCFLDMRVSLEDKNPENRVYLVFYTTFILIMIVTTVVCNIKVIFLLASMYRRGKTRLSGVSKRSRHHRSLSMTEEVEHLLPLVIITVVFICCTFPVVLININSSQRNSTAELTALRLLSFHSIINPWVLIILHPSVLKIIWKKLCRRQKFLFVLGTTLNAQSEQRGEGLAVRLQRQKNEDDGGHGFG